MLTAKPFVDGLDYPGVPTEKLPSETAPSNKSWVTNTQRGEVPRRHKAQWAKVCNAAQCQSDLLGAEPDQLPEVVPHRLCLGPPFLIAFLPVTVKELRQALLSNLHSFEPVAVVCAIHVGVRADVNQRKPPENDWAPREDFREDLLQTTKLTFQSPIGNGGARLILQHIGSFGSPLSYSCRVISPQN